nr:hypothetical protein B0A51_07508 [Rachicladosporium sp. CCFEE 5018]
MDFWSRLIGSPAPQKRVPSSSILDPNARLARFKKAYAQIQHLCDQPRNLTKDGITLVELQKLFTRLAQLIRDESRAPSPHLCVQFAASQQIHALVARVAVISHHEGVIHATVELLSTLVDSDEEDFLSNRSFAKSLMRLVTRLLDSGGILLEIETETAVLELLFSIAAKIRLEPSILPVWFASTAKPELEDVFVREKKSFVGITQKDDFPLCYLLMGRVHHEGRIGDFARTGLLYIFEATGRSLDLEEWVVSSDLPTLMASGLGALYSQLSRELSILHPDASLPAVLAMSDYSTTHPRATAESAFSERHQAHIATFLSYLAFWQDVLDHCRSADVKQTLLDHFQILFLQQLLYPSILQSSDTDAGSSIAVLTYVNAILQALDYPDLVHSILTYLLAIPSASTPEARPTTPRRPAMPPRSPTALKRRQSLLFITAPKNPAEAVEPALFNLVDLIRSSLTSSNAQTVYAALCLSTTILVRQPRYAFGTLLSVQPTKPQDLTRTTGALQLEVGNYAQIAASLHDQALDDAFIDLVDDARTAIEAQLPDSTSGTRSDEAASDSCTLPSGDNFMRLVSAQLNMFWSNSIDVNLALTQALASIALCTPLCINGWFCLDPAYCAYAEPQHAVTQRSWQKYLTNDESDDLAALEGSYRTPIWPDAHAAQLPRLYSILLSLTAELDGIRQDVPNVDQLIAGRKHMLQAADVDASMTNVPSSAVLAYDDANADAPGNSIVSASRSDSPARVPASGDTSSGASPSAAKASLFLPPPPESPSTTHILMQVLTFPPSSDSEASPRTATLNHVLTNVIVLQEFVLEIAAIIQARAAVLGDREVSVGRTRA